MIYSCNLGICTCYFNKTSIFCSNSGTNAICFINISFYRSSSSFLWFICSSFSAYFYSLAYSCWICERSVFIFYSNSMLFKYYLLRHLSTAVSLLSGSEVFQSFSSLFQSNFVITATSLFRGKLTIFSTSRNWSIFPLFLLPPFPPNWYLKCSNYQCWIEQFVSPWQIWSSWNSEPDLWWCSSLEK